MDLNERQEVEITKLRDEFHQVAGTHITWTVFWAILVLLVGIFTGIVSFILRDKSTVHDKFDERISKIEQADQEFKVNYATIMVQLQQIQKDILDVKTQLTQHDKGS